MIKLFSWLVKIIKRRERGKLSSAELKSLREDIRKQSRGSLEEDFFKLKAAYYVNKDMLGASNLEDTLNLFVDRIAQVMAVEIVSFMLIGKNKNELIIRFVKGLDKEVIKNVKVKLGEGVSGWVAKNGEPLLIKDISKDSRFIPRPNGKYYTNSLLSVPLKLQDKVIGVINVNNKTDREPFNESDLEILKTVADLSAVVVVTSILQEDVKELDRLRSDFIANVSHELRTPLTALKEAIALMLEEIAGSLTDKQKRLLELSVKNVDRLGRLIDDLLDFSKAESERKVVKRMLFDVVEMVNSVIDTLIPLSAQNEISIIRKLPAKKIEIWGDEDKLCQVVTNLVGNAINYNKSKGKVEVSLENLDKTVKLCVADTGIGIPAEDFDKLFDRFKRVAEVLKDEVKGSGLGLAISKEIVDVHGGEIFVESEVDQWSKFTVSLPKNLRVRR